MPGHTPWNKGRRFPGWAPGRMRETQFKKGERPWTWKPVGTVSADTEGFLRIKVREPRDNEPSGSGNKDSWPLLHHHVWAQKNGPVPPGYKIAFMDGNRGNCALENLELMTNAERMRRNSVHNLPKELQLVIQLAGALKRKIRETAGSGQHETQ
jgi:hypothetical protein